ncbi:hypothetical protein D3C73_1622720 [compost metagenome]
MRQIQADKPLAKDQATSLRAEYIIDENEDGSGVVIKKREYKTVSEIDTGDSAFDHELAIALCEKAGGSYWVAH